MRVIAGTARGRPLRTPPGRSTRPTSDRVREALFSSISGEVAGAVVLDLFAGSGALGIEALSRGAEFAVFVDADRRAVRTVVANLAAVGLGGRARVVHAEAARFCASPQASTRDPRARFDVVFCDPPYATPYPEVLGLLDDLVAAGALRPGALVVVERERRDPGLQPLGSTFVHLRDRTYGDTLLRYLRLPQDAAAAEPDEESVP